MPVIPMIGSEKPLEILADHCMAACAVIEEVGTNSMRELIDLLLYEVGLALAKEAAVERVTEPCDRSRNSIGRVTHPYCLWRMLSEEDGGTVGGCMMCRCEPRCAVCCPPPRGPGLGKHAPTETWWHCPDYSPLCAPHGIGGAFARLRRPRAR